MVCNFVISSKANQPRVGGVAGLAMILLMSEQPQKALSPMFVTELPMMSEPVKFEHNSKAHTPMLVTELPMVSEPVKFEQLWKAHTPMLVTEFGMMSEPVKPEQ